jgi:transcriptional regulator of acetoin/glycerol metabolism
MGERTLRSTTSRSEDDETPDRPGLVVVLECDRPGAGGGCAPLSGVSRVLIGRGDARRVERLEGGRALRLLLPDRKVSGEHAELLLDDAPRVRDLGSTNGTFVGGARVSEAALAPGQLFRVGHTFLALHPHAAPLPIEIAAEPWPFATLDGAFRADLDRLERVARSPIPLVLLGETGTGKEVVARAVHARSGRAGPFVAVNCGALPQNLVESLLFGHKKGAFSGALRDELGFFREADGGTLFLDEIGDLPLPAQAALLRALQEREVTPVGAFAPVRVDVRVLAATHRELDVMVQDGRFRADLRARLAGLVFRLPPLRARRCDLGLLLARVLGPRAAELRIRPDAALALLEHAWPHNVRELVHALETALVLSTDGTLRVSALPELVAAPRAPGEAARAPAKALSPEDEALRAELIQRLAERGGNVTRVAADMGKARQQIQRWMRRFGLRES